MRMTPAQLAALGSFYATFCAMQKEMFRRLHNFGMVSGLDPETINTRVNQFKAKAGPLGELFARIIAEAVTDPTGPMTHERIDEVLAKIECPSVAIETRGLAEGGTLLRVMAWRVDPLDGNEDKQAGRWFYVSTHATESEVVQTVWLAWQVFEHHELRESFKYDGVSVFHPHQRIDRLADFVGNTCRDGRSTTPRQRAAGPAAL